jgi:hypothetical protein
MQTDLNSENVSSDEDENGKGWTRLYLIVVGVLAAQIAFYAWLTKTFE